MTWAFSLQNVQFLRLGRRPRHSFLPCDLDLLSGIVYPLLEWDIVFVLGCFGLCLRSSSRLGRGAGGGGFAIEEPHGVRDHLCHLPLLAVLRLVGADLQPSLHGYQPAFAEMLRHLL